MKRLTLIIMAGLFMLGLTQCKKEQTNTNAEGKWVNITVKADGGDRHIVYPATGVVVYSDGDVIYVGNDGKYVGQLTYTNGVFSGDIYDPKDTDYLHFYFVGGKTPSVIPVIAQTNPTNPTTSFTVDISDQSSKLPVLSYGHSTQKYTDENATYACTLENQCALVEFSLTNETLLAVTLDGMLTNASINFGTTPGITPVTGTTGPITLYPENTATKWAILLPKASETVTTATIGGASYDVTVPNVAANGYVHGNNVVEIENTPDFVFTVGQNTTVHFAPGNLQATTSDNGAHWTWSFAANQYDCIGSNPGNSTINGSGTVSSSGTVTVDLFGWVGESSSYDNYGIFNSKTASDYGTDLSDNLKHDWGVKANDANLGGHNDWRTLTKDEWVYVFNTRTTTSGIRYAKAKVNNVSGVILLPDDWSSSTYSLSNTNTSSASFSSNTLTASQWSTLEQAGAVFLPAAGYRDGQSVKDVDSRGSYWSATPYEFSKVYRLSFNATVVSPGGGGSDRYYGDSVRLVR